MIVTAGQLARAVQRLPAAGMYPVGHVFNVSLPPVGHAFASPTPEPEVCDPRETILQFRCRCLAEGARRWHVWTLDVNQ